MIRELNSYFVNHFQCYIFSWILLLEMHNNHFWKRWKQSVHTSSPNKVLYTSFPYREAVNRVPIDWSENRCLKPEQVSANDSTKDFSVWFKTSVVPLPKLYKILVRWMIAIHTVPFQMSQLNEEQTIIHSHGGPRCLLASVLPVSRVAVSEPIKTGTVTTSISSHAQTAQLVSPWNGCVIGIGTVLINRMNLTIAYIKVFGRFLSQPWNWISSSTEDIYHTKCHISKSWQTFTRSTIWMTIFHVFFGSVCFL